VQHLHLLNFMPNLESRATKCGMFCHALRFFELKRVHTGTLGKRLLTELQVCLGNIASGPSKTTVPVWTHYGVACLKEWVLILNSSCIAALDWSRGCGMEPSRTDNNTSSQPDYEMCQFCHFIGYSATQWLLSMNSPDILLLFRHKLRNNFFGVV
jgi:hypothetical protein